MHVVVFWKRIVNVRRGYQSRSSNSRYLSESWIKYASPFESREPLDFEIVVLPEDLLIPFDNADSILEVCLRVLKPLIPLLFAAEKGTTEE